MSETFGIRIPPKTPPVSKAQLKIDLARFTERNKHLEWDYSPDVHVWREQNVAELLLDCIRVHEPFCDKEMSRHRRKDFIV